MSVYQHESPWSILDPSLEQHAYLTKAKEPIYFSPPTQPSIHDEQESKLLIYIKELNDIENELIVNRNSIYLEKLKVLQDELLSIEKETHKEIVKQDKKQVKKREQEISAAKHMYNFQLQSIDNQVEYEKNLIIQDIKQKAGFANKVVISEVVNKRKYKSPSTSDIEEEETTELEKQYKRIYLKKKIGKLQAISDRRKATKYNRKYLVDGVLNQDDLENDITMMRKKA